jgi:hypothetical protein
VNPIVTATFLATLPEDEYRWAGEGQSRVHLVHRRELRESGKRMTQSLCKVACVAYSLEDLPTLSSAKGLCGNCRTYLERITPIGGSAQRLTTPFADTTTHGVEPEKLVGYGSENQADHGRPGKTCSPAHR